MESTHYCITGTLPLLVVYIVCSLLHLHVSYMTPHIAIGIDKQLDYLVGLFLQDHMLIMLDQVYQLLSVIVSMKEGKYIIITNCAWSCLMPMQSFVVWSCLILLGNSSVGLSKLSAKAICHQLKMYKRWGPAFYINIHHHSVLSFYKKLWRLFQG